MPAVLITATAIANWALANIGQPRILSLDSDHPSATACKLRIDETRVEALSSVLWPSTSRWKAGVAVDVDPKPRWSYVHAWPIDALHVFSIYHLKDTDAPAFEVTLNEDGSGRLIHSNEEEPTFIYNIDATSYVNFDMPLAQAMAWLLAHKIAMPLTKNIKIQQSCWAMWVGLRDVAEAKAKNMGFETIERDAEHIEARY